MAFLSGFLQEFGRGRQREKERQSIEEFKKSQQKLIGAQIDALEAQNAAKARLQQLTQGLEFPKDVRGGELAGPPEQGQPKSLLDILTGEGAGVALQAGVPLGAIAEVQKNKQIGDLLKQFTGAKGMEQTISIGPQGPTITMRPPSITTQTVETEEGPEIKVFEERSGKEVTTLGPAKEARITPEQAGRITGLQQAQGIATELKDSIIKNGNIDRQAVFNMNMQTPFTKGRDLRNQLMVAADAVVRARTGATANETELKQIVEQLLPSPFDNDKTIKNKLKILDDFVRGSLDAVTLPPRLKGGKLPEGIPAGSRVIGKKDGKPVYLAPNGDQLVVE